MKKIFTFLLVSFLFLMLCVIWGVSSDDSETKKVDNTEKRTYNGTVYDEAYYADKKDGMRAKAYYYYLFSEAENKVLRCSHSTAGSGKTIIKVGTYEGTLGESVTITINSETEAFTFDGNTMRSIDGKESFTSTDVESAISKIKSWW